jgi:hypothetical protein
MKEMPRPPSTRPLVRRQGSTFGIPGVEEHTHFLRDLRHAEAIRNELIENIAAAGVPGGV